MVKTAKETGITREGLYKAFSQTGNPSFANVMKVMKVLSMSVRLIALPRLKSAKPKSRGRRAADAA